MQHGRAEQARHRAEGLAVIRLRYRINTHLDEQGIATPAGLAQATSLPAAEAAGLLRPRNSGQRTVSLNPRGTRSIIVVRFWRG